MKKLLTILAAFSLLSLTACGQLFPDNAADAPEEEITATEEAAETKYRDNSQNIPFGVYDADGNNYGGTPNEKAASAFKEGFLRLQSDDEDLTYEINEDDDSSEELTEEEIQETVDIIKEWIAAPAPEVTPLPEYCNEIPADWEEYTFSTGISFKAPAGLFDVTQKSDLLDKDTFLTFSDSENYKDRKTKVVYLYANDWAETTEEDGEDEEFPDELMQIISEKLDLSADALKGDGREPLKKLGISADSRYELYKALLTVTDEDLESTDKTTADLIRLKRSFIFSSYKEEAHILETDTAHIFIHLYGDNAYWVNVMPTEDEEYCLIVKAEDTETALKIASTIELVKE